jgi:hypothetical protein
MLEESSESGVSCSARERDFKNHLRTDGAPRRHRLHGTTGSMGAGAISQRETPLDAKSGEAYHGRRGSGVAIWKEVPAGNYISRIYIC